MKDDGHASVCVSDIGLEVQRSCRLVLCCVVEVVTIKSDQQRERKRFRLRQASIDCGRALAGNIGYRAEQRREGLMGRGYVLAQQMFEKEGRKRCLHHRVTMMTAIVPIFSLQIRQNATPTFYTPIPDPDKTALFLIPDALIPELKEEMPIGLSTRNNETCIRAQCHIYPVSVAFRTRIQSYVRF